MKKKYFILFIINFIIVFIISMSVVIFSRSNNNTINNKIDEEIKYLDNKFVGMIFKETMKTIFAFRRVPFVKGFNHKHET